MTTSSSRARAGLALLAVTGLLDLATLFALGDPDSPKPVVIASCLTGLVTLAGVAYAWQGRRGGMFVVLAALVIDLVFDVPAYFLDATGWVLADVKEHLPLIEIGEALVGSVLHWQRA